MVDNIATIIHKSYFAFAFGSLFLMEDKPYSVVTASYTVNQEASSSMAA